ncbi:hypothetical protein C1645_876312 [Glomus cerebriforme]|uniref:F-box domain-containing protein n=1 Tax=Glomus cerebriforme TaxID=658196 RepID=A0A397SV96_9GLOM|nr:hypothetical protein C1645_876312 [Glomus cerebriforme]
MSNLIVEDCLRIIFAELQDDPGSLYSCILVNKYWCRIAVKILWKNPYGYKKISRNKLYNSIFNLLPITSKQYLLKDNTKSSLNIILNKPSFNYISFSSQIPPHFIYGMIRKLVWREFGFDKFDEFEQEIYKLIINNCMNLNYFYWNTTKPLYQYPGASTFFLQLPSLGIDLEFVNSEALFELAEICQNIEDLKLWCYNGDISGLIMFLDVQKNLQSLYLYFKGEVGQPMQLSEVIERKATTLKKLSMEPNINLLSPKFLPSLKNLRNLQLRNLVERIVKRQEWETYLSISSFPNLQSLETLNLSIHNDCMIIEKSHGNILEIKIFRNVRNYKFFVYHEKLLKTIANNCPKIEKLSIDIELQNLNEMKEILLKCSHLKSIYLLICNDGKFNCDELLEVLVNFSPTTLHEFTLSGKWIFSINALQSFFESWRNRFPIIFNQDIENVKKENKMIVKKYYDEGIIKETNL